MWNLNGKVSIVTGGASGIGAAAVKALSDKGGKVVIADFNEELGKAVEADLKQAGADVKFIAVNVADEKSVENLVAETVKIYGRLDIMVNNAGVSDMGYPATDELSYDDFIRVQSINQNGVFFGSKYAIKEMLKTGGGSIVNTCSIAGLVGVPGSISYNCSKGAVSLMTKSLALEYATKNIRVNAVCPGCVESAMICREALGDAYDGLVCLQPIGRIGNADEIAHAIVFLCENTFTTGILLPVDGGCTAG